VSRLVDGRDADGTAAGRRLAEAMRAQASFTAGPAQAPPRPNPPPSLGHRADTPHPGGPSRQHFSAARFDAGVGGEFPTVAGPQTPAGALPARPDAVRPGWWSGRPEVAARVRLALLVALLVGIVLGCALGMMSVVVPGLFPALG
jgi:hypothetical protein